MYCTVQDLAQLCSTEHLQCPGERDWRFACADRRQKQHQQRCLGSERGARCKSAGSHSGGSSAFVRDIGTLAVIHPPQLETATRCDIAASPSRVSNEGAPAIIGRSYLSVAFCSGIVSRCMVMQAGPVLYLGQALGRRLSPSRPVSIHAMPCHASKHITAQRSMAACLPAAEVSATVPMNRGCTRIGDGDGVAISNEAGQSRVVPALCVRWWL
ncbi:hypothetical protein K431DRAFT_33414 [Polychaeton citri CBS 116435]|uniref:Uncharacterized protein n=1 Tax=Polychaeton citri CBS 116435 TaxID=1314669 RepID=A0A9P4USI6_9PEZI|nr:hypothetical protein K431DRAFT_33414 [Polychaeton citri CBS 116435]